MRKGKKLLIGNLWKYILVAVVSVFIWSAVFTSLGQIKDNQRLIISVYNLDFDTQVLRDEIADKLPELTQQEILELYVDDMEHIPNQTYATVADRSDHHAGIPAEGIGRCSLFPRIAGNAARQYGLSD